MSVKPATLENPERDLSLLNRTSAPEPETKPRRKEEGAELAAILGRIEGAKGTTPKDPLPHCGDCYRRGWAAALRAIEG